MGQVTQRTIQNREGERGTVWKPGEFTVGMACRAKVWGVVGEGQQQGRGTGMVGAGKGGVAYKEGEGMAQQPPQGNGICGVGCKVRAHPGTTVT